MIIPTRFNDSAARSLTINYTILIRQPTNIFNICNDLSILNTLINEI